MAASMLPAGVCQSQVEPLEDYLANRDFISSTQLRRFSRSGLVAAQQPNGGVVTGILMGEALHSLVLEPEVFWSRYLVLDDARVAQDSVSETDAMQRQWLDAWQWSTLSNARDALINCDRFPVAEWLERGRKELSIYWRDADGGCWKARPDCFTPEIVLDLKTTMNGRPRAFARARQRYAYDVQAAHYVEATTRLTGQAPRFFFLAVELSPPYSVWAHEVEGDELAAARNQLEDLKAAYAQAAQKVESGEAVAQHDPE